MWVSANKTRLAFITSSIKLQMNASDLIKNSVQPLLNKSDKCVISYILELFVAFKASWDYSLCHVPF